MLIGVPSIVRLRRSLAIGARVGNRPDLPQTGSWCDTEVSHRALMPWLKAPAERRSYARSELVGVTQTGTDPGLGTDDESKNALTRLVSDQNTRLSEWPERGMKSGSRLQARTAVVGFESGPWLLMIGDVGF